MKTVKTMACFMAMIMASSVVLVSCKKDKEKEPEVQQAAETPQGKNEVVKTQFAISMPSQLKNGANRMPATTVQKKGIDQFQGMTGITLIPFAKPGAITGTDFRLGLNIVLTDLDKAEVDSKANRAKLYHDVDIPLTTASFLFYAKSKASGNKFQTGSLVASDLTDQPSTFQFGLEPIRNESQVSTFMGPSGHGGKLMAYLTSIATATNGVKPWYETEDAAMAALFTTFSSLHGLSSAEVERVLCMVDSCLLLVDSAEGVMPQTKFVLGKALKQGLRPIVVINKIDKPDQRAKEVVEEIFDLFVNLEATDEQLDFPILYASGRDGWASEDVEKRGGDLKPLLDKIVDFVPCPKSKYEDDEFRFLATMLEQDNFLGRVLTGKIYSGKAKVNQQIQVLDLQNKVVEKCKITRIQKFVGLTRETVEEADAGEIVTIAGCSIGTVSNTLCSANVKECVPSTPIDPPTLSMTIGPNTSPLAGKSGKKLTSNMIKDRLEKEAENNIAITIKPSQEKDSYEVGGRGELQLGVLIETMRREGFELSVARPKVVIHTDENGNKLEPIEEITMDVDDEFSGTIIQKLQNRKGEMKEMKPFGVGRTRLVFLVPTRCLMGYQSEFMTDTRAACRNTETAC